MPEDRSSAPIPAPALEEALQHEQRYVDTVYDRVDHLRRDAENRLRGVRRAGASGTHQSRSERDAFATLYTDRLAQLNGVEERLVFGRLDLDDGARRYVGRIGVSDADQVPLLTDWRAPAARAFYQATAASPDGVVLRRHLQTRGREVVAIEDDLLDADALTDGVHLQGEGALMSALLERRTGQMSDIVATIQSEQDAIIRSPADGVLVVQGGPGTGKTAVALHRAAYLLYANREVLERAGVLLIGPSRVFLKYIEAVLPSLGESGVVSLTLADLVPDVTATGTEPDEVATIKGRAVWARILARAVRNKERVLPPRDLEVGNVTLRLLPGDVREGHTRARRAHRTHNEARATFVRHMLTVLARQYADELGGVDADERADLIEEVRSSRDVRVALNLCWMPLTAVGVVSELFAKPHKLADAARGALSRAELAAVQRPADAPLTPADVLLVDEVAELIGPEDAAERGRARAEADARRRSEIEYAQQVLGEGLGGGIVSAEQLASRFAESGPALTTAERALADRAWTYGHVVVDEAQELSEMAWRALLRRNPRRSMTVVGDVAQTSARAGVRRWADALDGPLKGDWRVAELTVNYRTPRSVMDLATAVATAADPERPPSPVQSARDEPEAVTLLPTHDVLETVRAAVERARERGGTVAVVAPREQRAQLAADLGLRGSSDLTAPLVVLDPAGVKGLEFDHVILVEPAAIAAQATGAGDLYVAMTRPTRHLDVVHTQPLPAGFERA
ncbi:HelD family protein [Pseudactinotalea suaedae]|uniref:HelD family protein n=1 Tax=Pseudactinotalea suaedae TaxID=1524924 RepID=UPI001F502C91|nr:AAA family ATPase [Pseudactinotalea suaedae]